MKTNGFSTGSEFRGMRGWARAGRANELLPCVAVFLAALAFLLALNEFDPAKFLYDPDSQWHIAVGRWIRAHHNVPWVDEFSYTYRGQPWIAKEWLSQLLLYTFFEIGGWRGVVVATCMFIAATFAFLYEFLRRRVTASAALMIVPCAFMLAMPHMIARPHTLVMPIIVAWFAGIVGARDREAVPSPWLALLIALWANMHASFPLGVALAGVLAAEGVLLGKSGTFRSRFVGWFGFVAATCAATLATPYGWHTILVPLEMAGKGQALQYVQEWSAMGVDLYGAESVAAMLAVFVVMARDPRSNVFRMLALGILSIMSIMHVRFVPIFGMVAPVLIARALAGWPGLGAFKMPVVDPRTRSAAAALAVSVVAISATIHPAPPPDVTPEAAVRFAQSAGLSGNVYNAYDFGGYLIDHGIGTFVDGRPDQLFLGNFMPSLVQALKEKDPAGFTGILDRYDARWALVSSGSLESNKFAGLPGWKKVYSDGVADVFSRL